MSDMSNIDIVVCPGNWFEYVKGRWINHKWITGRKIEALTEINKLEEESEHYLQHISFSNWVEMAGLKFLTQIHERDIYMYHTRKHTLCFIV